MTNQPQEAQEAVRKPERVRLVVQYGDGVMEVNVMRLDAMLRESANGEVNQARIDPIIARAFVLGTAKRLQAYMHSIIQEVK